MKTNLKKLLSLTSLLMISLALSACGKKSDDNNNVNTSNGYQMVNGICYLNGQNTNNPNLCYTQGTNSPYQMVNGICYLNGQNTNNPSLCYNQTNNGCTYINGQQTCQGGINGAGTQRQCYGQFYDMYNRIGTCNGVNCAGWTLREVTTNLTVQCI